MLLVAGFILIIAGHVPPIMVIPISVGEMDNVAGLASVMRQAVGLPGSYFFFSFHADQLGFKASADCRSTGQLAVE